MSLPNASWFELVYTSVVLVGVLNSAWCLWDAILDQRAVRSRPDCDTLAMLVAHANVSEWSVFLLVQVSFLSFGVLGLFAPPARPRLTTDPFWSMRGVLIVVRLLFLAACLSTVVHSVMTIRARRLMLHLNGNGHPTKAPDVVGVGP